MLFKAANLNSGETGLILEQALRGFAVLDQPSNFYCQIKEVLVLRVKGLRTGSPLGP